MLIVEPRLDLHFPHVLHKNTWKDFPVFHAAKQPSQSDGGGRRPCADLGRRAKHRFSPTKHGSAGCASRIPPPVSQIRRGSALTYGKQGLQSRIAFPVFPCCGAAFPIRRGRPKALRRHGTAGETQFQPDETWLRQVRIAHPPPVSQIRRGSAQTREEARFYAPP